MVCIIKNDVLFEICAAKLCSKQGTCESNVAADSMPKALVLHEYTNRALLR